MLIMQLSKERRILFLENWWKYDKNYGTEFTKNFPNEHLLTRQTMSAIAKKFHDNGSVNDKQRSEYSLNQENNNAVEAFYDGHPQTFQVRASLQLGIVRSIIKG